MPAIQAFLQGSYPSAVKARLKHALTGAVADTIPGKLDQTTVCVCDTGGPENAAQPKTFVKEYLLALEQHDIEYAERHLAAEISIQFPGAAPMHDLESVVRWAAHRYRFIRKTYNGYDQVCQDGTVVVFARGTLEGQWPDGQEFEGIRFIDRFEIRSGKIMRHDVWNDMGESRAAM